MQSDRHQHEFIRHDGYRRFEAITGEPRRQWSDEEKARIVSESFAPGANISAVARRHGISGGLLHKWRGQARQAAAATAPFIPIALARLRRFDRLWLLKSGFCGQKALMNQG
jgi:transposase